MGRQGQSVPKGRAKVGAGSDKVVAERLNKHGMEETETSITGKWPRDVCGDISSCLHSRVRIRWNLSCGFIIYLMNQSPPQLCTEFLHGYRVM